METLSSLKELSNDIATASEGRLLDLERLCAEIEVHAPTLGHLLDKKGRSEASRTKLNSGEITIDDQAFRLNDGFKQSTLTVADILDLDELDAAKLFLSVQQDQTSYSRNLLEIAIVKFHEQRHLTLATLESILKQSLSVEHDETISLIFSEAVKLILGGGDAREFRDKCLLSMVSIESAIQDVFAKIQTVEISGGSPFAGFDEIMAFQKKSLLAQHCSLGLILGYLVSQQQPHPRELAKLNTHLASLTTYNDLLVHHIPYLSALLQSLGNPERKGIMMEAREVHHGLKEGWNNKTWAIPSFQAAVMVWWLSEYGEWYDQDRFPEPLPPSIVEQEEADRAKLFQSALDGGALDFTMSLSADVKPQLWYDPIRHGLRHGLQTKAPFLVSEKHNFPESLQVSVLTAIEAFVDAFISNLPDTIRQLRNDEEERRRATRATDYGHDLEKFLVLISYTYERRQDAANTFWVDTESNLYGFLLWAAKRPPTPRASALCEVITAISEGSENAESAHNFLLHDTSSSVGKLRRTNSVSWSHILSELQSINEKYSRQTTSNPTVGITGQTFEDKDPDFETLILYESYLRLAAHLCRESSTVREWIMSLPNVNIVELCLNLGGKVASDRIRACCFDILASLLTDKTQALSESIWVSLEQFVSGSMFGGSSAPKPGPGSGLLTNNADQLWETLSRGFETPNSFLRLLDSLLLSSSDSLSMTDRLPFPENLGSSTRMPGVESYIDFAMGTVFGRRIAGLGDDVQKRTMRLTCLDFILTCLTTFNEDLVIFANRSDLPVDSSIRSSSLSAYVHLHPFSRVMEWMFNDRVIDALFECTHQDAQELLDSNFDSPLVLSVLRAIQVILCVFDLQTSYLTIVRPSIKLKVTRRSKNIGNSSLATFEDAVLNHLSIVPDLCRFCITGHHELVTVSLSLLERLSSSSKLINSQIGTFGGNHGRNKLIGALEMSGETERISFALAEDLRMDVREIELGPETPAYALKNSVLSFLSSCLGASSDTPSIAHLLLGFLCQAHSLTISSDGYFANESALFHTIVNIATQWPENDADGFRSWLVRVKFLAIRVLQILWSSQLSSSYVYDELRSHEFLASLFAGQTLVGVHTAWEQRSILDPLFFASPSASCLADYLKQRTSLYEYAAAELRLSIENKISNLTDSIIATLFGSTKLASGEAISNSNIFDLFDFSDLQVHVEIEIPALSNFEGIDFEVCLKDDPSGLRVYDISSVKEILDLRRIDRQAQGQLNTAAEVESLEKEANQVVLYLHGLNQQRIVAIERLETLTAWAQLIIVIVDGGTFDAEMKRAFVLRAIQVILPKLELFCQENIQEALILAYAIRSLLFSTQFSRLRILTDQVESNESDQLYYLFQVALRAIHLTNSSSALRLVLYQICLRYLSLLDSEAADHGNDQILRLVKATSGRLLRVICDDAAGSDEACRVSALMMLDSLAAIANAEGSNLIVRTLSQINFIEVTVDSIKYIPSELRESDPKGLPLLLSYFQAKLALLLRLALGRSGATSITTAGFFQSLWESGLFSVDPDIGVEIDNPNSLERFYELLLSALRIVNAIVLSKGPENAQSMDQARKFLSSNRNSMIAVFKRHAGIGGVHLDKTGDLEDLVENYILLIRETKFLDFEEEALPRRNVGTFL